MHRSLLVKTFCYKLLFVLACGTIAAHAGDSLHPVSAEELRMTNEPLAPGAPAIILYRQVDRDDSGHSPHEINYVRTKILTEEGRKYANVEIPFIKAAGNDVINIKGRTIHPDGLVTDF